MQHAMNTLLHPQSRENTMSVSETDDVHILVFITDITRKEDVNAIAAWLNYHPDIIRWSVDRDDTDHVLRIESDKNNPEEVIELIKEAGYACKELSY